MIWFFTRFSKRVEKNRLRYSCVSEMYILSESLLSGMSEIHGTCPSRAVSLHRAISTPEKNRSNGICQTKRMFPSKRNNDYGVYSSCRCVVRCVETSLNVKDKSPNKKKRLRSFDAGDYWNAIIRCDFVLRSTNGRTAA